LIRIYSDTCNELIKLIPEYGSFGDLINMIEIFSSFEPCYHVDQFNSTTLNFFADSLVKDWNTLKFDSKTTISLAAKWAPREKGHFANICSKEFKELIKLVKLGLINSGNIEFEDVPFSKLYRNIITKLNVHLNTVEVFMCSDKYQNIDFSKVPSVALKKWRKAFLNEKINEILKDEELETGNRYPENKDRVLTRANLKKTIREKKVKGGQLQAHEIVSNFNYSNGNIEIGNSNIITSIDEKILLEAQWEDMRKKIQLGNPRAIIPMADVSRSMTQRSSDVPPISVSVALSILLSEITHHAFRDRVLTFSSDPKWINLSGITTLEEKIIKVCEDKSNGMNTNLEAAFDLILKIVIDNNLTSDEIPALVIFSDMQFDKCVNSDISSKSTYESASEKFKAVGLSLPQVIFWNLDTSFGFPTDGSTPGTTLLSGYSQSLFKYVVFGEEVKEQNTYDLYREIIDDERYDLVRTIVSSSIEISKLTRLKFPIEELKEYKPLSIENPKDINDNFDIFGIGW
jgi:hypothetical protein